MGSNSKIEWLHGEDGTGAGATWNPIRARLKIDVPTPNGSHYVPAGKWGYHCERISPGCQHCYACTMNGRTLPAWGTGLDYTVPNREKVEVFLDEAELLRPLKWRKPKTIFPCSMTDAFADFVPDEFLDRMFAVAALCPQHRFLFLTKRAKRMQEYFCNLQSAADRWLNELCAKEPNKKHSFTPSDVLNLRWMHWRFGMGPAFPYGPWPLPNVWLGVSVEDQQRADERIPLLLQTPAAVRWISAEPLLGPLNLGRYLEMLGQEFCQNCGDEARRFLKNSDIEWTKKGDGMCRECGAPRSATGYDPVTGEYRLLNWIVVGGESGPGARPCDVAWIRSIVRQCRAAEVACFVKQLGGNAVLSVTDLHRWLAEHPETNRDLVDGAYRLRLKDRKGGAMDEWPHDIRVRQRPEVRP